MINIGSICDLIFGEVEDPFTSEIISVSAYILYLYML